MSTQTGETGVNGKGGAGGIGKADGAMMDRHYVYHSFPSNTDPDPTYTNGSVHANGANGTDGTNKNSQVEPTKGESINLSFIVRNYKKHLREKLVDSAVHLISCRFLLCK